jgi:hypothetical protein
MGDQAQRLRALERLERAVHDLGTALAFAPEPDGPYGDPQGPQLLADVIVARSSPTMRPNVDREGALERLRRSSPKLQRALVDVTTADLPGLLGSVPLPRFALDAATALAVPSIRLLDALEKAPLAPGAAKPWVPIIPPITPAAPMPAAEKTELASRGTDIPGDGVLPTPIGEAHDLSWSVFNSGEARDALVAIYTAETLAGIAAAVVADLEATTTVAPTIADAIATLDGAGYPATVVISDRSAWLATTGVVPTAPPTFAGLDVVFAPVTTALVLCNPAVWLQVMRPQNLEVAEPNIGGYEVSCLGAYVLGFPTAAVCKVAAV